MANVGEASSAKGGPKGKGGNEKQGPVESGVGLVRAVTSGDCVTILQLNVRPNANGMPPEKRIILSNFTAPRLGRSSNRKNAGTKDEPFAWDARECLRKHIIGQRVNFVINYKNPNGLLFGTVLLNGTNVANKVAEAGLVHVRASPDKREADDDHKELLELSRKAQEAKIGLFTEDQALKKKSIRPLNTSYESFKVYEESRKMGKPREFLVEHVRDGSTLRGVLKPSFQSIVVRLAGIQAPTVPFNHETKKEGKPEPFYRESLFFAEQGVLNRDVELTVTGVDATSNSLMGTVAISGRDLGAELLKVGLARVIEWNSPTPEAYAAYRAIEQAAQKAKIRMWHNFNAAVAAQKSVAGPTFGTAAATVSAAHANQANESEDTELVGRVREIQNGGNICIRLGTGKPVVLKVLQLSSITVPRLNPRNGKDEPYAWEAKHLLRKRLIGKKIRAQLDYARQLKPRDGETEGPTREYWSVYLDRTNVAMMLVERGYAKVVRHRQGEPRSPIYSQLILAEEKCRKNNKGIFGKKAEESSTRHINDLTRTSSSQAGKAKLLKNAKSFLPFLLRSGRQPAVVEHVYNGSRVKVYCPNDTCIFNLALSSVRCPNTARRDGTAAEPFGPEAAEFTTEKVHQRDVVVEVEAIDRVGTFVGRLFYNNGSVDLGQQLVQQGLASVHEPSARRSKYGELYLELQNKARQKKLRMWKNYEEKKPEVKDGASNKAQNAAGSSQRKQDWFAVHVTEIVNGSTFYIQRQSDAVKNLEQALNTYDWGHPVAGFDPAPNTLIAAQFSEDKRWYRARVVEVKPGAGGLKDYVVQFVDYGNHDRCGPRDLRPLPLNFSVANIPLQSVRARLAFVRVPAIGEEYGEDAAYCFRDLVWGKTLMANIEGRDGAEVLVSLGNPESNSLVACILCKEGLARPQRQREKYLEAILRTLEKHTEEARQAHVGMWRYGDAPDEDDVDDREFRR